MRSMFIVTLLLLNHATYARDNLFFLSDDTLLDQVQNIEHILDEENDLLDVQELKIILSKILVIIKDLASAKRSYTNIAYVHGLLSVNDELVQNITATSLSATDEIISNSLTILPFNTAGVLHNNGSGLLSSSLIVNADVNAAAAIVDTKLATISTAGKVANSATTATAANTASTIVARDASGNFSATTITANLSGNATTATTATNFSGSLSGDVTGTQSATVVSTVGGQTAANVAAGTVLANAATSANTASSIVRRSATGGFSAGAVSLTDEVISNTLTITPFSTAGVVHNNASGLLSSSLIVNADINAAAAIADTKLATISTAGKVTNSATTATSANTASAIVTRDASGNFSAGTITANLSGNATTATTATNFSGSLSGDVTGTQSATVVSTVGGQTAANVAAATVLANAATSANTANAIVQRTATGGFSAGAVSLTDEVITNSATITPFTTAGVVHNNASGLLSSSLIVNADVDPAAAIVDTKLATISTAGKVANSATTATSANTANTIVLRNASGNFSAGTISITDTVSTGNLVFTGSTSTSTTGNITKGANSFIHNFGTNNTFVGISAGNFTTSGTGGNTAVGAGALAINSTGQTCVAVGSNALSAHTSGTSNVAVGVNALSSTTTSNFNIGVGSNALQLNVTGTRNVAIGDASLSTNTTGSNNVAMGKDSLINTTGSNNTAIGDSAGNSITTGGSNIIIGSGAGGTLTTGSGNIYINANAGAAAEATTSRIGTSQTRCFIAGISGTTVISAATVLVNSAGQLGTILSSAKVKHDIEDMGSSSDTLMQLRPVTFVYNDDESETTQYGLIAEEVEQVFPDIVVKDINGNPETVQYHVLPVLLLNELQKQRATIAEFKEDNISRDIIIRDLVARLSLLENIIHEKI